MSMSSPVMEISIDGDTMSIKNISMIRTVQWTFKLGEEYDEVMPNTTIKVKHTELLLLTHLKACYCPIIKIMSYRKYFRKKVIHKINLGHDIPAFQLIAFCLVFSIFLYYAAILH